MSTRSELAHMETQRIRNSILRRFLETGTAYLSGGELASQFAMTRTAIWKHIRGLEELGFVFEATPRRGYRLVECPNLLLEPLLRSFLGGENLLGKTVYWFESVDSTNALASELARNDFVPHGTVVTAKKQAEGRGRQGKHWISPEGGLWMSVILKKPVAVSRAAELTLMASVAILRAVRRVTGVMLDIKWPNDLLYKNKKVCGILAELRAGGENVQYIVLGIGLNSNINWNQPGLESLGIATSLMEITGKECSQAELAAGILDEFEVFYQSLTDGEAGFASVAKEWRQHCVTLGKHVRVQTPGGETAGIATSVDDRGVLCIRQDNGKEISVHSGEVLF